MADYYVDHGAYATNLGSTPTWGVPQEGDGSATTAATASSVGSILLNAQPSTGNLLSICGVSFGATSGGTINYTIGGSISATVDNIVAAINAATTTVGSSVALGTPQLRNLVFARNTGGTTVEIMMRVGSTLLNHATNANVLLTHTGWGTAPTFTQFAGGSGGCWGWFNNPTALGVSSSIAVGSYGAMVHVPYVAAAKPTLADNIYARTGGGASKTISYSIAGALTISHSTAYSKRIIFDTNTKWTGDSTTGKIALTFSHTSFGQIFVHLAPALDLANEYIALADYGFEIEYNAPTSISSQLYITGTGGSVYYERVKFIDSTGATNNLLRFVWTETTGAAGYSDSVCRRCYFYVTTPVSTVKPVLTYNWPIYNQRHRLQFFDCDFNFNINGVSDPGPVFLLTSVQDYDTSIEFYACRFAGYASGYKLTATPTNLLSATYSCEVQIVADACSGLALPATYVGLQQTASNARAQSSFRFSQTNAGNGFRIEDSRGVAEWVPNDPTPFPTLTALDAVTGTAYSMRLIWIQAVTIRRSRPYCAPPLRMQNTLATGTRTLTLELFVPTSVTTGIEVYFGYIDSGGTPRIELATSLASSSAPWTNSGSYGSYAAKKLALTTAYSVLTGYEITAHVRLVAAAPSSVVSIYVDPEFGVA